MILDYAKSNAKTKEEEKLMINDMHNEAMKIEQKIAFENDRKQMKAQVAQEVMKEKDPIKSKEM